MCPSCGMLMSVPGSELSSPKFFYQSKMISCSCPNCLHQLSVPDSLAGSVGMCPNCGKLMTIPNLSMVIPILFPQARMILFSCSECLQSLQVLDAFSGQVGKCVNCSAMLRVPFAAEVARSIESPSSSNTGRTSVAQPSSSKSDSQNRDPPEQSSAISSLTDSVLASSAPPCELGEQTEEVKVADDDQDEDDDWNEDEDEDEDEVDEDEQALNQEFNELLADVLWKDAFGSTHNGRLWARATMVGLLKNFFKDGADYIEKNYAIYNRQVLKELLLLCRLNHFVFKFSSLNQFHTQGASGDEELNVIFGEEGNDTEEHEWDEDDEKKEDDEYWASGGVYAFSSELDEDSGTDDGDWRVVEQKIWEHYEPIDIGFTSGRNDIFCEACGIGTIQKCPQCGQLLCRDCDCPDCKELDR
jgi:hypothetical protein